MLNECTSFLFRWIIINWRKLVLSQWQVQMMLKNHRWFNLFVLIYLHFLYNYCSLVPLYVCFRVRTFLFLKPQEKELINIQRKTLEVSCMYKTCSFVLKMASTDISKGSPLLEELKWGFMKVEGCPPGKDFKLFPGGSIVL